MNLKQFNYSLIIVDQTESTNTLLCELKKSHPLKSGAVVLANSQTNGKGQKGNQWLSEPEKNLTFSVLALPLIKSKYAYYLNMVAALAVHKTLKDLKINAQIKWPNDILVNGKKIAGILIENQLQGKSIGQSIIGIGLNVNQIHFNADINATSLKLETLNLIDKMDVLEQCYQYLDFYYNLLIQSNFKLIKQHYLSNLYRLNQNEDYNDCDGPFKGTITGIDETGRLSVKKEDQKVYTFDIQEISYR